MCTAGKFFRRGNSKHWIKSVTYGPFEPRESDDVGLPPEELLEADLQALRELGANTLRVYEPPPTSFLDTCSRHGLQVLISVPWADHIDFLRDPQRRTEVVQALRQTVGRYKEHPALLGYFVGNEIQATMVRWLGARKVKRLLEDLIDAGREVDSGALFAYANYPSTEYLNPDNADFVAYNVYLEEQDSFEKYLARLQNIAGDKPLLISEFGIDSKSHGANRQAAILEWHIDSAITCGAAGTTIFAFTDDWFRGGKHVDGWDFGMVDRSRVRKPAFDRVREKFSAAESPNRILLPTEVPKVSIIVCTYNGARTLRECLASLEKIDYPDYEVLVVDDGSTDETPGIIESFSYVRKLHQDHGGLSNARNLGAAKARGSILVYTDDDCVADEHWISHLVAAFDRGGYGAVGGPNISPPASSLTRACVAAAPGAPAHVLLTDRIAEHIPGCNLAVTREAFEKIGGFMPEYRTAGDDVDFCWRIQEAGYQIGFAAGAMVWHYRRFRTKLYLKQQIGYGKAEAILIRNHAQRFGMLGGARWHGMVYQGGGMRLVDRMPRIYQGVFGYAPFQAIYTQPRSDFFNISTSFQWLVLAAIIGIGGFFAKPLWIIFALMLVATLFMTAREALRLRVEPPYSTRKGRLQLFFLCLAQPVLRGGARFLGTLKRGTLPRGPLLGGKFAHLPKLAFWKRVGHLALWSEDGADRDGLLGKLVPTLNTLGWPFALDNGWKDWDLELNRSQWWVVRLTTVTEYHGDGQDLTRVRFASKATTLNIILNIVAALGILTIALKYPASLPWMFVASLVWWIVIELHHRQIVNALADVVTNVGKEIGFKPVRK